MNLLERRRNIMCSNEKEDDKGLFAYWDGADAFVDGFWVDKINGLRIGKGGTVTHGTDYYEIVKTADAVSNWLTFKDSPASYITNEFIVRIDCDVLTYSDYCPLFIDFGAYGQAKWSYAFCSYMGTSKNVVLSAKTSTNTVINREVTANYTDWELDGWNNNVVVKVGIRLDENDKQVIFSNVDGYESYTAGQTKVTLDPHYSSVNGGGYGWIGALLVGSVQSETKNFRFKLRIRSIKFFNKS